MAEVAIAKNLFAESLRMIAELQRPPNPCVTLWPLLAYAVRRRQCGCGRRCGLSAGEQILRPSHAGLLGESWLSPLRPSTIAQEAWAGGSMGDPTIEVQQLKGSSAVPQTPMTDPKLEAPPAGHGVPYWQAPRCCVSLRHRQGGPDTHRRQRPPPPSGAVRQGKKILGLSVTSLPPARREPFMFR
jgi:hypothetical protein